jgi:hypothetical protein
MKRMNFDKTLLEAVDHALLSFGESPRKAIYYHLDKSFKIQKEDIPEEAEKFAFALNAIFGSGAAVIEKLIVKDLYQRLNLSFEEKSSYEIADYISLAREVAKRDKQQELVRRERARRK